MAVVKDRLLGRASAALGADVERRALATGAFTALMLQGVGAALAFALQVLLGRWLGAGGYGDYSFTVAWAGLIGILISFGLPATTLRFVPAYIAHQDWSRLRGILRVSLLMTVGLGAAVGVIGTAAYLASNLDSPDWRVLLGIWLAPLLALRTLQQETVRGFRRMVLAYAPTFVLRPAAIIVGCGAFLALSGDLDSQAALVVTVAVFVAMIVGQELVFWLGLSPELRDAEPRYEAREWLAVALPLLLIAGFAVIFAETGIVLVGAFLGSSQAGIFAAAMKTSAVVGLLLLSINAIAAPMLSSLYAQGRLEELDRLTGRVARWSFWPTLAISVVLAVAAKPVMSLFGSEFRSANWILIVLLAGQLVNAGAGAVGFLLTQTGHQRDAARVYGWTSVFYLGLNLVLIPTLGTIGAALAAAIGMAVWNVWLHHLVRKRLGIHASVLSRHLRS